MASFNRVILVGNLTRDPELRYTPKGLAICNIDLAINRNWTTESGEKKEEVTFVNISAFGRLGENVAQYMKKGRPLLVEGRLSLDQWEEKTTGQKRSRLKVIAETVQFLGSNERDDSAEPTTPAARRSTISPLKGESQAELPQSDAPTDEDVPF